MCNFFVKKINQRTLFLIPPTGFYMFCACSRALGAPRTKSATKLRKKNDNCKFFVIFFYFWHNQHKFVSCKASERARYMPVKRCSTGVMPL